jgi:hypothetical protein
VRDDNPPEQATMVFTMVPCFDRVGCDRIGERADMRSAGHAGIGACRQADGNSIRPIGVQGTPTSADVNGAAALTGL